MQAVMRNSPQLEIGDLKYVGLIVHRSVFSKKTTAYDVKQLFMLFISRVSSKTANE